MTYAGGRRMLDADSHVMELAEFLDAHIDAEQASRLRRGGMEALAPVLDKAVERAKSRRADPDKAAAADARLLQDKGWSAMGASDPMERRRVLDVGGGGRLLDRAFHNNAMPVTDHLGGGENIRSKDFLAIHHSPELFLGALIYDGIFDRFPDLRGGCIEQGAGWVVSWMHHLD